MIKPEQHLANLKPAATQSLPAEVCFPRSSYDGSPGPIPQPEGPLFPSGCRPSLPVSYGMCHYCLGDPQCRFQRLSRRVLHGSMVLLLRDDGGGVLPGRHPPPQLPACVLGKPHSHMCSLRNSPVSHLFGK